MKNLFQYQSYPKMPTKFFISKKSFKIFYVQFICVADK